MFAAIRRACSVSAVSFQSVGGYLRRPRPRVQIAKAAITGEYITQMVARLECGYWQSQYTVPVPMFITAHQGASPLARPEPTPKHVTAAMTAIVAANRVNLDAIIATIAYAASYITDYRNRCCSNPPYRTSYSIENFACSRRPQAPTNIAFEPAFADRERRHRRDDLDLVQHSRRPASAPRHASGAPTRWASAARFFCRIDQLISKGTI